MIIVKNLRRPGLIYDSTKMSLLGQVIGEQVKLDSQNEFFIKYKIKGYQLKITMYKYSRSLNKYIVASRGEQEILSGRISKFLNSSGVVHDIVVQ